MIARTPPQIRVRIAAAAAALAVLVGAAGCGSTGQATAPDDRLTVVASTDVWASVVRAVAGDAVQVDTIIDDPSGDPHSYEASAADAAAIRQADLIVYNGGGYDEFVDQALDQGKDQDRTAPTVSAVAVAGAEAHSDSAPAHPGAAAAPAGEAHDHGPGANEHVWYDLPVVQEVARQVAEELGRLDPAQRARFTAAAEAFRSRVDDLRAMVAAIAAAHTGDQVVLTEPVAYYLITAAGLTDATPPKFVEAVEAETDPPAAAVAATRELLAQRRVRVLIYNPQTETPVTSQVRTAAEAASIPVVTMTETLPAGTDYPSWMAAQIGALAAALQR